MHPARCSSAATGIFRVAAPRKFPFWYQEVPPEAGRPRDGTHLPAQPFPRPKGVAVSTQKTPEAAAEVSDLLFALESLPMSVGWYAALFISLRLEPPPHSKNEPIATTRQPIKAITNKQAPYDRRRSLGH